MPRSGLGSAGGVVVEVDAMAVAAKVEDAMVVAAKEVAGPAEVREWVVVLATR